MTHKTILFFCCLLVLPAAAAQAAEPTPAAQFEQANQAATRGNCEEAVNEYLQIAANNGISASLLYNMANCYTTLNRVGQAVVNYERALRLDPGNADIEANLEQIRKDAGLYQADRPLYERLANLLGADQWLLCAGAGFFLLALTALAANLPLSIPSGLVRLLSIGALLLLLVTLPPALLRYQAWNDGVVMGTEARLLISPFPQAASTGTIKAGRMVRPQKKHGEYILVRDETGRSGWLHSDMVAKIADSTDLTTSTHRPES